MSMSRSVDFLPLLPGVFSFFASVWFAGGLCFACSLFRGGVGGALLGLLCGGRGYSASARLVRAEPALAVAGATGWSAVLAFLGSSRIVAARVAAGVLGRASFFMFADGKSAEASLAATAPVGGVGACRAGEGFPSAGGAWVVDSVAIQ